VGLGVSSLRASEEGVVQVGKVRHVGDDLVAGRAVREGVEGSVGVLPDHLGENVVWRSIISDERDNVPREETLLFPELLDEPEVLRAVVVDVEVTTRSGLVTDEDGVQLREGGGGDGHDD